jgi:putative membrane protein
MKKEIKKEKLVDNQQHNDSIVKPVVLELSKEKILILSVDRDNDIGQKIGQSGPIIGIVNNKKLASDLATADPEESDANCIFGAIKKYNELKDEYDVEIATLTGHSKENFFYADKNITIQLKQVLEMYPATGVVLVTDGAEDDQVMPLIQNFVPIISKETIIVRQSKSIENTFYIVKKAFQDPFFARIVYGIPAIILLLFVFVKQYAFQIIALLAGFYFLVKGFGLDHKFNKLVKNLSYKFSIKRVSFIFYIFFVGLLLFAIGDGIYLFLQNTNFVLLDRVIYVIRAVLLYVLLAAISAIIGSIIDLFYLKKMYLFSKNIFFLFLAFVLTALIDLTLQWSIDVVSSSFLALSIFIGVVILILFYRFTKLFDINKDVTPLLIGLPVQSRYGLWVGEVVGIDEKKELIRYIDKTTKSIKGISKKGFILEDGKIII